MLNDKNTNEWRNKVKSIFTEAQKLKENAETPNLDMGSDEVEDPSLDMTGTPDGSIDGSVDGAEEEEPTITLTASLLKALLDYCEAPHEEETSDMPPVDGAIGDAPVDENELSVSNPQQITAAGGICEDEEIPAPVAAAGTSAGDAGDDALSADSTISDVPADGAELTSEEIVQKLIDLSSENEGAPLDVDCLSSIFSSEEGGEDLGGDIDGNVELPATGGDQTLPPAAPATV